MSYNIIEGDLDPDMALQAIDASGSVADLSTAVDISLYWVKPDGTTSTVPLVAVSLALGQVKRVWVAGDTAQVGVHMGRIVVTAPGGETRTYPNDGSWLYWWVNPAAPCTG